MPEPRPAWLAIGLSAIGPFSSPQDCPTFTIGGILSTKPQGNASDRSFDDGLRIAFSVRIRIHAQSWPIGEQGLVMGDVTPQSALRDVVVTHGLDPDDAAALIPIQTAARTQKGAPWRLESRKFYDALMEGVLPHAGVTFESATIGGVPGVWVHPASSRS